MPSANDSPSKPKRNQPLIPQSSLSNTGLRPHGIDTYHGTREVYAVKQFWNGRNFITLLIRRLSGKANGLFIDPRRKYVGERIRGF